MHPAPSPRFTDNANGTITDKLTGLIWLKNADCFSYQVWTTAVPCPNTLANGACGLTDGSTAGQWRLPNVLELSSLVNEQQAITANWLNTQGFTDVQASAYWSSSTRSNYSDYAWYVEMVSGYVGTEIKTGVRGSADFPLSGFYGVWPVRGGQ